MYQHFYLPLLDEEEESEEESDDESSFESDEEDSGSEDEVFDDSVCPKSKWAVTLLQFCEQTLWIYIEK